MKIPLIFLLASVCCFDLVAQETIVPLSSRSELYQLQEKRSFKKSAAAVDTIELPFFDDFSGYFNKKFDNYYWPDTNLWMDRHAFVNDNLARDPYSVGVVTLDGANELGQPNNWFAGNTGAASDTLTSVPINLEGKSGVILSFYYQAGGISTYGPEFGDKLLLEFLDEDTVWSEVWATNGLTDDSTFFRAMIPIDSAYHLFNGFQFRFRNYATLHTNGDFWHLDYIELDEGRTLDDTLTNDISILQRTQSLLKDYSSMPWEHYRTHPDPNSLMFHKNYLRLRNDYDEQRQLVYRFEAKDLLGTVVFRADTSLSTPNISALTVCGNLEQGCNPSDTLDKIANGFTGFYPANVQLADDSAHFTVSSMLWNTPDVVKKNDTVVYVQKFYNYYSYDDGTAEVAFGLGNIDEPGSVAVKYDVKMADDLLGVQIYFDPVKWNLTDEFFQLEVWSGDSIPETLVAQSDTIYPEYTLQNVFYHYFFDEPVSWSEGPMFIGWKQQANPDLTFTVGFDLHRDRSEKLFYNLGSNWIQSSIPGSVMIRPLFGEPYVLDPISVEERPQLEFSVYPNPANNQLNIRSNGNLEGVTSKVVDIAGREVDSFSAQYSLDISHLEAGVYILVLQQEDGSVAGNARFIKQ